MASARLVMRGRRAGKRPARLLLTCEHGGNRIPREYARLFRGAADVVRSHRGWDPGALDLARFLGRAFGVAVHAVTWCRLFVESNRASTNHRIWSSYTADLPGSEKATILDRYWWPHRRKVEALIQADVAKGYRIVHVAVHSFTPVMDGVSRNADIGLLYDSQSPAEKLLCTRWQSILESVDPALRVRRNYPYRGTADGLPTWLRRRFAPGVYSGVEFEANQSLFVGRKVNAARRTIADSLAVLLRAESAGGRSSTR